MSPSWPLSILEETPSTNTYIAEQVRKGRWSGPKWIMARRQTAGRGTNGRDWSSLSGNLFLSVGLFHTDTFPMSRYGVIAALSVRSALVRFAHHLPAKLKWPNDVRVEGEKISGILIESFLYNGRSAIIIGFGVNVASCPNSSDIQQAACCLADFMESPPSADMFCAQLRHDFEEMHASIPISSDAHLRNWNTHAEGIGERINVSTPAGIRRGTFHGINEDGAMILDQADAPNAIIHSGTILPP